MTSGTKWALIIGGIILALLVIVPMVWGWVAGPTGYYGWGMGPGMMGGFGSMFFMPIIGIVVLGLIIWAVIAATRGSFSQSGSTPPSQPDSALEVLRRRYARGEINKQEFEEKMKDLSR